LLQLVEHTSRDLTRVAVQVAAHQAAAAKALRAALPLGEGFGEAALNVFQSGLGDDASQYDVPFFGEGSLERVGVERNLSRGGKSLHG
jgi:hypothetical protein